MNLLIRNGIVIDTEPDVHVRRGTDILITDGVIGAIGPDLPAADAEVIDAAGQIVLPGFVDTHRHVWQSVLRSVSADAALGDYLALVLGRLAPAFRPEDVYAANLWGAVEALNAGITTVYDWSHIQLTPGHTDAAVEALRDSGARVVFAYAHPGADDASRNEAEVRRVVARHFPSGDSGLVTPAFAAWGPVYGSVEAAEADWRLARELGLRISLHATGEEPVERLHAAGLLGPDVMFVHANGFPDRSMKMVADSGGTASVAPAVESQMGHGSPETGRLRGFGIPTGLGVDTVAGVPGDMFAVMRAALASARLRHFGEGIGALPTAADILRMATIEGATALGMADRIGSLRPGKRADVVMLDTGLPNLAPPHDPVGAVVTAADVSNVDTVIVGGEVVKRAGRLVGVDLPRALDLARRSGERLLGTAG